MHPELRWWYSVGAKSRFRWKLHPSSQAWPLLFASNRGETAIAKCGNWDCIDYIGKKACCSNHPRVHTVNLGRMPWEKNPLPPLATLPNPVLSYLSGHSDTIVLEPIDVTLWYSDEPWLPNLLKISSDIESDFNIFFFSILHTDFKLNRISVTIISKVARKCIWCCARVQRCVTAPYSGGKLCSGAWKHGQNSHVSMFSLWILEKFWKKTFCVHLKSHLAMTLWQKLLK